MLVALGTPLTSNPRPWKHFEVPALLVNAYEIIKRKGLLNEIRLKGGLHSFLEYDGVVFMDSGGFQAMKYGVEIDLNKLAKIYLTVDADYYFSLDYPSLSSKEKTRKKIDRTIKNFKKMRKHIEKLIPIVHPNLTRALEEYEAYLSLIHI